MEALLGEGKIGVLPFYFWGMKKLKRILKGHDFFSHEIFIILLFISQGLSNYHI